MTISVETGPAGRRRAVVQGSLTIYDATADKQTLLQALDDATEMEVDLSSVSEMDTAGLQVLILVKRESIATGKPLRVIGHSEASLDVLDRYNLASYFGDPVVITRPERRKSRRRSARR